MRKRRFYDVNVKCGTGKDSGYCPYCNKRGISKLTEEHVVPKSLGGTQREVIFVCHTCNSSAGAKLDARLCENSWIAMLSFIRSGRPLKSSEQHESEAILKCGRKLSGSFYFKPIEDNRFQVAFRPQRRQSDGSIWVHEDSVDPIAGLPPGMLVYKPSELDMASISTVPPSDSTVEPSMLKILLGMLYGVHGESVVSDTGFDALR